LLHIDEVSDEVGFSLARDRGEVRSRANRLVVRGIPGGAGRRLHDFVTVVRPVRVGPGEALRADRNRQEDPDRDEEETTRRGKVSRHEQPSSNTRESLIRNGDRFTPLVILDCAGSTHKALARVALAVLTCPQKKPCQMFWEEVHAFIASACRCGWLDAHDHPRVFFSAGVAASEGNASRLRSNQKEAIVAGQVRCGISFMDELRIVDQHHFAVGRRQLHKHFALDEWNVSVLTRPRSPYVRQLCLKCLSDFASGRVPLYLCRCGDLECGALTASVTEADGTITWSDFGWEGPSAGEAISQNQYMSRTGPFVFEKQAYLYTLSSFM